MTGGRFVLGGDMYRKILVCLDGSQLAEQILPYAVAQAQCFQSQLVLLRVTPEPFLVSPPIPGVPGVPVEMPIMEKRSQRENDEAQAYLEDIAERLNQENGLVAECVALPGVGGSTIIMYAEDLEADLIAIATHGHGGLRRAVFGSVADHVLNHSKLPILIVRPRT
jgi:nucleotide-binding universal stress UspA family protein